MFSSITKSNKSAAASQELIEHFKADIAQLHADIETSYNLHAEKDAQIKRSNDTITIHNKIISEQSLQISKLQQQLEDKKAHENFKNFIIFIIALIVIAIAFGHYT
jgi:peptidoglycan hydrolase CwlO-like protein